MKEGSSRSAAAAVFFLALLVSCLPARAVLLPSDMGSGKESGNNDFSIESEQVEEAGSPSSSPIPIRYVYTPYGEAYVEKALEIRRIRFDSADAKLGAEPQVLQDPLQQSEGAFVVTFSAALDAASLQNGVLAEQLTTAGWKVLQPGELLVGFEDALELKVLARQGWQKGSAFRVQLNGIRDTLGRGLAAPESFEWKIAAGGGSSNFNRNLAVLYESAKAASDTLGGRFPGGQSILFQGAWTDPLTGLALHRARWYDPRNAGWLSEDPALDFDSPNLYAFVGWAPQSGMDPLGLFDKGDNFEKDIKDRCKKDPGSCVCKDSVCTFFASLTAMAFGGPLIVGAAEFMAPTAVTLENQCLINPTTCTALVVGTVEIASGVPNPTSPLPIVGAEQQTAKLLASAEDFLEEASRLAGNSSKLASLGSKVKLARRGVGEFEVFDVATAAGGQKRSLARGDEFLSYVTGQYGIYAHLDEDGIFNFYIRAAKGVTPTGREMFEEALNAFGLNVAGVRGTWIGGGEIADNFNSFRQGILAGLSPAQAALETFTGKMASRAGFTRVEIVLNSENKVVVEFSK